MMIETLSTELLGLYYVVVYVCFLVCVYVVVDENLQVSNIINQNSGEHDKEPHVSLNHNNCLSHNCFTMSSFHSIKPYGHAADL